MEGRREIDPDTGQISYKNIEGSGLGDMFSKIASKLTGKTASKLASKLTGKLIEKGAEKLMKYLVKKFMISFHLKVKSQRRQKNLHRNEVTWNQL